MTAPARGAGPAATADVRGHNASLVLRAALRRQADPPSRAQLAAATGLTRATVSAVVDELISAGLLQDAGPTLSTGRPGRPGSPLLTAPRSPVAVGVEIDVDMLGLTAVALDGQVISRELHSVDLRDSTPAPVLRQVITLVKSLNVERPLAGVGIAVPGLVDPQGVLRRAPNLLRWHDVDIGARLSAGLDLPVVVDNDANLAALAHREAGTRTEFVYISGEVGVGAGLVLGGQVFHGGHGFAGEFGHVVVDPRGPRCGCGGRGCVEQFAGELALLQGAGVSPPHGPAARAALLAAVQSGKRRARTAVTRAGTALGVGLASLVNLVDIEDVVLGGVYVQLEPWLVPALRSELDRRIIGRGRRGVRVSASTLGPDAAMRGAAITVLQQLVDDPLGRVKPAR